MGERKGVSRRTVIGAVAGAMAAPSLAAAIWVPARRKPRSESWQSQTADGSITARYSHTATALPDGRVLVVGGYPAQASLGTGRSSALSSAEIFDPVQRNWRPVASMQSARAGHAAISLGDGRVAVLGGYAEMALATVEIYDSRSDSWTFSTPMSRARYGHSAVFVDGTAIVVGGRAEAPVGSTEIIVLA